MKGLSMDSPGVATVKDIEDAPVRPDYVKVRVQAVGLNPTDWKHIHHMSSPGAVLGCDVAGVVEEVGSAVQAAVAKGDRITGFCHGGNATSPRDGGFAERAELKDGLFAHVPADWSWAEAAGLGVGITTVGQALYQSLQLPLPKSSSAGSAASAPTAPPTALLIYGGSTATGSLAIQFAKLSGLRVLTTASPQHTAWLKSLGAEAVFDYNAADVGSTIRAHTHDQLHYAFDCIVDEASMAICAAALAAQPTDQAPNHYSALLPPKGFPRDDCNSRYTMAYTATGEAFEKRGRSAPAKPEDWAFAAQFWALAERLMKERKFTVHPVEERAGGLDKVGEGLDDLRLNKVRGKKLVYVL